MLPRLPPPERLVVRQEAEEETEKHNDKRRALQADLTAAEEETNAKAAEIIALTELIGPPLSLSHLTLRPCPACPQPLARR